MNGCGCDVYRWVMSHGLPSGASITECAANRTKPTRNVGLVEKSKITHPRTARHSGERLTQILTLSWVNLGKGFRSPDGESSSISTVARGMMRAVSRRSYSRFAKSLRRSDCILSASNVALCAILKGYPPPQFEDKTAEGTIATSGGCQFPVC
jgi:hypothetical protein